VISFSGGLAKKTSALAGAPRQWRGFVGYECWYNAHVGGPVSNLAAGFRMNSPRRPGSYVPNRPGTSALWGEVNVPRFTFGTNQHAKTAEVATASNDPADRLDCRQAATRRGLFWSSRLNQFPMLRGWDATALGSWREGTTRSLCLHWQMMRTVRVSLLRALPSSI